MWHRRSGKDLTSLCFMVRAAHKRVGEYYYILPQRAQADKVMWHGTDFKGRKLLDYITPEVILRKLETQRAIYFNNGSVIKLVGSNFNADRLRGTNPVGAIFSEAAWMSKDTWTTMRPAFVANNGWMLFQSTPDGKNDFYQLYKNVAGESDWFVSVRTILDTRDHKGKPIVDKALVERDRKTYGMSKEKEEQEYYCKFHTAESGYYYQDVIDDAREDGRVGFFPWDENKEVYAFYDLGISDATSIWFVQIEQNRKHFIDYYETTGKPLSAHVKYIYDRGYKIGAHYLPHDGSKRTMTGKGTTASIYQDLCYEAGVGDYIRILPRSKVQEGIDAVRGDFKNYYFHVAHCHDGLEKLLHYRRKMNLKTQSYEKIPLHDKNSHAADALRAHAMAYYGNLIDYDSINVNMGRPETAGYDKYLFWGE